MGYIVVIPWPVHLEIPLPSVVLGLITGMAYASLAAGLVLIYRASRVVNLAQAEIGAASAVVLALLVRQHRMPYWMAFIVALGLAAAAGGLVEAAIIRLG